MSDNPMVVLNHAIAGAMVHGPEAGLELIKALDTMPHARALPSRCRARTSAREGR
jgi:predicted RNA polymerase sigma factor